MSSGQVWETPHLIIAFSHQTFAAARGLRSARHWVVSGMDEKIVVTTGSSFIKH